MSIAFVTGLPHYVSSQAVETAARKVGPIERVVRPLARDGSRLHFAYVFCEDADTAATLVSDGLKVVTDDFDAVLDVQASTKTEEEILSKRSTKARVRRVQDRHVNDDSNYTFGLRLFVGNLDSATTTEELAGVFARFGEVQSVVRPVAATDSAFVTMTTYQAAGAAVDAFLSGSESLRAADQTSVRVEFARPQTERRPTNSVYIAPLPIDTGEQEVRDELRPFLQRPLLKVRVVMKRRREESEKPSSFAIVTAQNKEDAEALLKVTSLLNNDVVVEEARPRPLRSNGRGRFRGARGFSPRGRFTRGRGYWRRSRLSESLN